MTTENIKELSEKLARMYGVEAWTKIITSCNMYGGVNYEQLYLAEDSGRISDLADDNGVDTNHGVLDAELKESVNSSYITANEYFSVFERYADHPSKSAAARMARVKCLIAIGEAK